jgi:predicted GH43/DUF377 family glycosyl hydrolase
LEERAVSDEKQLPPLTRRQVLAGGVALAGAGVGAAALWPLRHSIRAALLGAPPTPARPTPLPYPTQTPRPPGTTWPWTFAPHNPVLDIDPSSGWELGAVYDPSVVRLDDGSLRMWYSTRGSQPSSIALASDATGTGDHWTRVRVEPVLTPAPPESYPYPSITRPSVVALPGGGWRMWYSTQGSSGAAGTAWIGAATSSDGVTWQKHGSPVLAPRDPWEKQALQCPNVRYDATSGLFQMWYSGGDQYEPDAIGYATSPDGIVWTRSPANPIYTPTAGWEDYKVGSFQVHRVGDWYYAFYNAFQREPFVSRIGMARSRDGVGGWQRHPSNPLISPGPPGSWNARMIYKPTALWNARAGHWDVWFNASMLLNQAERIGHAWSDRVW